MKTNFFEQIAGLAVQGALNLNIMNSTDKGLTVSVYLPNETKDNAGMLIPPMILKGSAAELDEAFFTTIATPLEKTTQLFANMDAYQKSLEKATAQSQQELDKKKKDSKNKKAATTSEKTEEDEDNEDLFSVQQNEEQDNTGKKQRYDEAMVQISDLNKLCKYEEAISLLPSAGDYPEKSDELNRKRTELQKRKEQYEALMQDI